MKFVNGLFFFFCFTQTIFSTPLFNFGFLTLTARENLKNENQSVRIKNKNYYILNLFYEQEYQYATVKIDGEILSSVDVSQELKLFLGSECYIKKKFENWFFLFGRQIYPFYKNLSWEDGFEGFSLNYQMNDFWISLQIADLYRGFPLYKKERLGFQKKDLKQENYKLRQGFFIHYLKKSWSSSFFFQYMNLGNWGKYSRDVNSDSDLGDQDFLFYTGVQFSRKWDFFHFQFLGVLNQGIDRAVYRKTIISRNNPINGEAIFSSFSFFYKEFKFELDWFIPDVDLKNENGEILEYGFIGMGSNPISASYIARFLDFYPSAWITQYGFEKQNSLREGRQSSSFLSFFVTYSYQKFYFSLGQTAIYRRIESKKMNGKISFRSKDYHRPFYERSLKITYKNNIHRPFSVSIKVSQFKIKLKENEELLKDEPKSANFFSIEARFQV